MRFYIATGLDRWEDHRAVHSVLREEGHQITFDWTRFVQGYARGSDIKKDKGFKGAGTIAGQELGGVLEADVVIVLLPGGSGTHAELGAALASGKLVLIHALEGYFDDPQHIVSFYKHSGVSRLMESGNVADVATETNSLCRYLENLETFPWDGASLSEALVPGSTKAIGIAKYELGQRVRMFYALRILEREVRLVYPEVAALIRRRTCDLKVFRDTSIEPYPKCPNCSCRSDWGTIEWSGADSSAPYLDFRCNKCQVTSTLVEPEDMPKGWLRGIVKEGEP